MDMEYEISDIASGKKRTHEEDVVEDQVDERYITNEFDLRKLTITRLMSIKSKVLKESTSSLKRREDLKNMKRLRREGKMELAEPEAEKPPERTTPVLKGHGPKIHIVNGEIQIDTNSLLVSAKESISEDNMEVVDESAANQHITNSSFKKSMKGKRWTAEETEKFYQCLQWFGTDFGMISVLFPYITRRHVKMKFIQEEKVNSKRVTRMLLNRIPPPESVLETMRGNQAQRIALENQETVSAAEVEKALKQTEESTKIIAVKEALAAGKILPQEAAATLQTIQGGSEEAAVAGPSNPSPAGDAAARVEEEGEREPTPVQVAVETEKTSTAAELIPVSIQRLPVASRTTAKGKVNFKPTLKKPMPKPVAKDSGVGAASCTSARQNDGAGKDGEGSGGGEKAAGSA
ncbi:Transcription factor TFIIIB component B [Phlyctochytrium planicorne]|nr:Transcription factor TFIIIB component B [Phlyctochytrium planicorne]